MSDVFVLAADLGGTNLRMAAIAFNGTILSAAKTPTPEGITPPQLIEMLLGLAADCRASTGLDAEPRAIAVGVPANVSADGVLCHLPNLPTLEGMDLRTGLESGSGLPVIIENDAAAAAIGENWLGTTRDVSDSVLITLGTGVGGGIIINNELLRGCDGTAGKIGHICVEPQGFPCGCGSRGCIEQYASATAIVRMAREAGIDSADASAVYRSACSGDERARAVFTTMGTYLGITLGGLINALNPEMVVIGGGAAAAWDMFIGPLIDEMNYRAFSEPAARVKIVKSELGDNAGMLGGARSAFLRIGSDNS